MPSIKKKEAFTVKTEDGKVLELAVNKPSNAQLAEVQKTFNKEFSSAVLHGDAIVRGRVQHIVDKQELWTPEHQKEYDKVQKELDDLLQKLVAGGMKKSEGRALCFEIMDKRAELRKITAPRNSVDSNCADAQAENARFNHLVSLCTVYNDDSNNSGKPYFESYQQYLEQSDSKVAVKAATKLAYLMYNMDPAFEANLPENKFLRQHGMMNDELELVNADNHRVDRDNRLVDEEGRWIDEHGNYLDKQGRAVDKWGNPVCLDAQPFTDD